jgi:hypothetical protein
LVNKRADNFEKKNQGFYTLLAKDRVTLFPWKSSYLTLKITMVNFITLLAAGSMVTF